MSLAFCPHINYTSHTSVPTALDYIHF